MFTTLTTATITTLRDSQWDGYHTIISDPMRLPNLSIRSTLEATPADIPVTKNVVSLVMKHESSTVYYDCDLHLAAGAVTHASPKSLSGLIVPSLHNHHSAHTNCKDFDFNYCL